MFQLRVEEGTAVRNHESMVKELLLQISAATERSKDMLVQSIREDLASKILRPRESDGGLSNAIDGEVIKRAGDLIIGIGNINRMNKSAPHWRLQEQGGPISVRAVPGYFVDQSGTRVPFDQGRAAFGAPATFGGFVARKISNDLFVYDGGKSGSIMWVHNEVRPKRYFEAGELKVRTKVLNEFERVLRSVFR